MAKEKTFKEICDEIAVKPDYYISMHSVIDVLRNRHINNPLDSDRWVTTKITSEIAAIPAADVRENKCAHWQLIEEKRSNSCYFRCSSCRQRLDWSLPLKQLNYEPPYPRERYCSRCGAYMQKGGKKTKRMTILDIKPGDYFVLEGQIFMKCKPDKQTLAVRAVNPHNGEIITFTRNTNVDPVFRRKNEYVNNTEGGEEGCL